MENKSSPEPKPHWINHDQIALVILQALLVCFALWGVINSQKSIRDAQFARRCYMAPAEPSSEIALDSTKKNIVRIEIHLENHGTNPANDVMICSAIYDSSFNQFRVSPCIETNNPWPRGRVSTSQMIIPEDRILYVENSYYLLMKIRYHDRILNWTKTDYFFWIVQKRLGIEVAALFEIPDPEIVARLKEMGKEIWPE